MRISHKFIQLIATALPYAVSLMLPMILIEAIFTGFFHTPMDADDLSKKSFLVHKGDTWTSIAKRLKEKDFLKNEKSLSYSLWLKKWLLKDDKEPTLQIGEYIVSRSYAPHRLIKVFINKEVKYHKITLPEGFRNEDLPKILEKTGLVTETEVKMALLDPLIRSNYGIQGGSLEGYVFPNTYNFTRPTNAKKMLMYMVHEGAKIRTSEKHEIALKKNFNFYEILILASIIEKETGVPEERKLISSVFHNRLKVGMKLQSDPTVIYGIKNFNGNLTLEDLKRYSPWNTYVIEGLPPTPICNPGKAAIEAALHPEKSDYLYFVAKGDGTHKFSKSYREHQKAVNKYQRGGR